MLCKNELWQAQNGTTVFKFSVKKGINTNYVAKKHLATFSFRKLYLKSTMLILLKKS